MASLAKLQQHLLLVTATVAVALLLAAADTDRRRPVHLQLYMHDIIGGPGQTAIHLIHRVGPPHTSLKGAYFGDTEAIDDLVTEGPAIDSRAVGRAQGTGTYMLSSQHEQVLVVAVTVVLTDGLYSGSTFAVAGRVKIFDDTTELAVVGGTGQLRRAAGHLLWRTAETVSEVYMVLELFVHMSVPAMASTAAPANGSSPAIEQ